MVLPIKWPLVAGLVICAIAASLDGRAWLAIALGLLATTALLAVCDGSPEPDDGADPISVDRLALVLVYSWSPRRTPMYTAVGWLERHCREAALQSRRCARREW